ncbi:MAG: SBBP repeat-containing protein [Nitrospira sp.]
MSIKTRAVMSRQGILLAAALSLVPTATLWAMTTEEAVPPPRPSIPIVQAGYGKLPLSFEANQGQWDPAVQFVTRGGGHTLFLTPSEAVLTLQTGGAKADRRADHAAQHKALSNPSPSSYAAVRMRFKGADYQAEMVGLEPLPGIVNYFIGDDPTKWHTNIPTYQRVEYKNLYAGIDLVYYGNQGQLEYDLVVAPGADPTKIMLAFDGAERITVDEQGDLVLTLPQLPSEAGQGETATLRLHKPVVYQRDEKGEKHLLAGSYAVRSSEQTSDRSASVFLHPSETQQVTFQVASYDPRQPLIIDPVLSWATYLGRSGDDGGGGIAVDQAGNVYVTGGTSSSGFPGTTDSPIQSTFGGNRDVFVTKLNATGTALVYSTYLGGSGNEGGSGIAIDAAGNAYVTGATESSGFPGTTDSPIQSTFGGNEDAFITKLNATGTALVYSTYLGGSGYDSGSGIALDQAGQVYVTGFTGTPGSGFPGTAGSLIQSTYGGKQDAFVTKLNAAGTALVYSTYLGGSDSDTGAGIAVDQAGQAYVTGNTISPDFPGTTGSPIQDTYGGNQDAFVTKLNATGTALVYSTYLGSSGGFEFGTGIAVDQAGQAYVTGITDKMPGSSFPGTAGSPIQSTHGGGEDAFVTKLNATGTALVYSTYLGGSDGELGTAIAVDQAGQAYVTGSTNTPGSGFPGTAGSLIQSTNAGGQDVYVTKLNATGTAILYSTYLGGSSGEIGNGIAVDTTGNAYVTGTTGSGDFPGTVGSSIQSTFGGGGDAFVAKITSAIIINDLVTFEPLASTYRSTADPTGCPSGFVGTFGFDAQLTNKNGSPPLSDLAVKVTTLSDGNLLRNADGGNGGVGSTLTVPKTSGYADGTLSPGESVGINFSLCLKSNTPFTFFVDVLGMQ